MTAAIVQTLAMSDSPSPERARTPVGYVGNAVLSVEPRKGLRKGAYAGFCGAVGMAIIASVFAGVFEAFENETGDAGLAVFVFLLYGLIFAVIFGPIAGMMLGSALVTFNRASAGPVVGLLAPFVILVPLALAWGALDDGAEVLEAAALSVGAAGLFAPAGYLAGKLYLREMTT